MAVGTADLHKVINTAWEASTLNASFQVGWSVDEIANFEVLEDGEAAPGQPFPYCTFEAAADELISRMSGESNDEKQHIRDVPWTFNVFVKTIDGDSRTAKEIAASLAEEVLKVFGGHPTTNPTALTMDSSKHLITQLINEFGIRVDDDVHQWVVVYNFRIDVPVKV